MASKKAKFRQKNSASVWGSTKKKLPGSSSCTAQAKPAALPLPNNRKAQRYSSTVPAAVSATASRVPVSHRSVPSSAKGRSSQGHSGKNTIIRYCSAKPASPAP